MNISEYQKEAKKTDKIPWGSVHDHDIPMLGVIGEVGSVAAVLKKRLRDADAYENFEQHLLEELGDVLWYIAIIANRFELTLEFNSNHNRYADEYEALYDLSDTASRLPAWREKLGYCEGGRDTELENALNNVLLGLDSISASLGRSIEDIAKSNILKVQPYWIEDKCAPARRFDEEAPDYEQFSRDFEVVFREIPGKKALITYNDVNIGDRLTDNAISEDGYRYHDVFHVANAAMLGWSPVFRRMLNKKRKYDPEIDEVQDGARAAIIEELVVNQIFEYVRDHRFMEGLDRIDPDLIKRLSNLVKGYEVEICQPWEWKHCILEGCRMFRLLRDNKGGKIKVDAESRSMEFERSNR